MKKIILLIALFLGTFTYAQQTFDLDWAVGINGADASVEIETGDTVRWTWTDELPHTVTSISGSSQETFDSGTLTGLGQEFSYTFTQAGTNDYQCDVHPATMFGTITVNETLAVEDKFAININWFPNPVSDALNITSLFKLNSYQVVDVMGKIVQASNNEDTNVLAIDMSSYPRGMYFVTLVSGDLKTSIQVIKN